MPSNVGIQFVVISHFLLMTRTLKRWSLLVFGILIVAGGCNRSKKPEPSVSSTASPEPSFSTNNDDRSSTPEKRDSNDGNLLLGNVSNARKSDADNFLLERPQYSMSYNSSRGSANWVAWHVDRQDLGETDRGKFRPDPRLPASWRILPTDYRNSGYDRGHICPSGDRTASREDNDATFYMSNMMPQTGELNRHVWSDFEGWLREQVRNGNEAYQIAGGAGNKGTIAGGRVTVPEICWKVVVLLPSGNDDLKRINTRSRIISIAIPNVPDARLEKADWRSYLTSPFKIEKAARINLFSRLPVALQQTLKAKVDQG